MSIHCFFLLYLSRLEEHRNSWSVWRLFAQAVNVWLCSDMFEGRTAKMVHITNKLREWKYALPEVADWKNIMTLCNLNSLRGHLVNDQLNIHPSIVCLLSGSRSQQGEQISPEVFLPNYILQYFLGGPKALTGQMGYVNPPACSGPASPIGKILFEYSKC